MNGQRRKIKSCFKPPLLTKITGLKFHNLLEQIKKQLNALKDSTIYKNHQRLLNGMIKLISKLGNSTQNSKIIGH